MKTMNHISVLVYVFLSFQLTLLSLNLLDAAAQAPGSPALSVIDFSSPPNYALSSDAQDRAQLTDGQTVPFPIWARRGAVGWENVSSVIISLRFKENAVGPPLVFPRKGELRVHTAKGSYAGVDAPRHVDVYAQEGGRFYKVGSMAAVPGGLADKSSHWLRIPIASTTNNLVVIVHANGRFLFLDELTWVDQGVGTPLAKLPSVSTKNEAQNDSINTVHRNLFASALTGISTAQSKANLTEINWSDNPWNRLAPSLPEQSSGDTGKELVIEGTRDEIESACLGMTPGADLSGKTVRIEVTGVPSDALQMYQVKPVIAANGEMTYDPLDPLGPEHKVVIPKEGAVYIWFSFNLSKMAAGKHTATVFLTREPDDAFVASLSATLDVKASPVQAGNKPKAITWAYLLDYPVWRNPDVAFKDLVAHGINIFTINHADIPGILLAGTWNVQPRFSKMVELARGRGTVLLFLGWSATKNPLNYGAPGQPLSYGARQRLKEWLGNLIAYFESQGMSTKQWALYPVDEVRGNDLLFLEILAKEIKTQYPQIQLYANPTFGETGRTSVSDLYPLKPFIDIWQPNLRLVQEGAHVFFNDLNKPWWIYRNPSSPAKRASPLHDYRLLPWWAWIYGADGIGFWSYSSTEGSSAWNDVDGRQPDWAVVYEAPAPEKDNRPVSSRRWEAFREGLEDYYLLSLVDRPYAESLVLPENSTSRDIKLDELDLQDLRRIRHSLLQRLP